MNQDIVISKSRHFHSACIMVRAGAARCCAFLADGRNLAKWLADQPTVTVLDEGVYKLTGPEICFVKIIAEGTNTVWFHVGEGLEQLEKRIAIALYDLPEQAAASCLINLLAFRMPNMTEERWQELCQRHEQEIGLIKQMLEA